MGALGETLYFETPDCHLVALNMKDGTKKWDQEICDLNSFYYASVAPVVIKNHVMIGVSGDDRARLAARTPGMRSTVATRSR